MFNEEKPVMGRVPFNGLKHTTCIETAAAKTVMAMPSKQQAFQELHKLTNNVWVNILMS